MTDRSANPLIDFFSQQIKVFQGEALRLRDPRILREYEGLAPSFFSIQNKLGTVDHERALAELAAEYHKAYEDSWGSGVRYGGHFGKDGRRCARLFGG
jgi:hypothetical protein